MSTNQQAARILVVDDDADILEILVLVLRKHNFEVISTNNGLLVPQMIVDHKPDLVFLDVDLGNSNGAEICRSLKQDVSTSHIPVLLISATFNLASIALENCADDFLPKPFDIADLISKCKGLLQNRTR